MLSKKIYTNIVIVIVCYLLLFRAPEWIFIGSVWLVMAFALREGLVLAGIKTYVVKSLYQGLFFLLLLGPILLIYYMNSNWEKRDLQIWLTAEPIMLFLAAIYLVSWTIIGYSMWRYPKKSLCHSAKIVAPALFSVSLCAAIGILVLYSADEPVLLYMLIFISFVDICGYVVGRIFGGRKSFPMLSPKKTWSGTLGSIIIPSLVLTLVPIMFKLQLYSVFDVALFFMFFGCLVIVSQLAILGDLFFSFLKRINGVEDSGTCLPGHGGFLDRLDSHICAIPFGCVILMTLLLIH